MTALTASAPGKLILCGEHAVVYRRPALVAAVDLRLASRLQAEDVAPSPDHPVVLRVPTFGLDETASWRHVLDYAAAARRRWRDWSEGRSEGQGERPGPAAFARVRSDDPAHVLKVALGEAAADLGEDGGPPLEVTVDSELPTGSGFGSSAAAAVTVVAGYRALRRGGRGTPSIDAADPAERSRVEALALEVERRQHGSPSGVDGAAVLHGGLLWAERGAGGRLDFLPFRAASNTGAESPVLDRLAVFDTGTPAEGTGTVVAAVRERSQRQPQRFAELWDEIETVTRAFRTLLQEPPADAVQSAIALVRRCQRALEAAGVVPAPVRDTVAAVEAAGGAAKISGAGSLAGPGAGSLLVLHTEPAALDELPALAALRRYPVSLGGPGLRLESTDAPDTDAGAETPREETP